MKWINVKDRLPEKETFVIAYGCLWDDNPNVLECYYNDDGQFCFRDAEVPLDNCTHWMPLPEPPKDEK